MNSTKKMAKEKDGEFFCNMPCTRGFAVQCAADCPLFKTKRKSKNTKDQKTRHVN